MKLTDQALSCVMVALQKSLMEQTDIVPVLKGFEFITDEEDTGLLYPYDLKFVFPAINFCPK